MALFKGIKVGDLALSHRVVMAPMTRTRTTPKTESFNDLNVLYYQQRASKGGLIISEVGYSELGGRGYVRAPGFSNPEQLEGWKRVASTVHDKGGFFFAQIFHAGRVSHSSLLPGNKPPVAPSAVAVTGPGQHVRTQTGEKVPYETPTALTVDQIQQVIKNYVASGVAAVKAGCDGVEIHVGNGYLHQEFLALATNKRTDKYGGSVANRARFLLETIDQLSSAIGSHRVGVKLQPGIIFSGFVEGEDDVFAQLAFLGPELSKRKLAYVCLSSLNGEPYYKMAGLSKPNLSKDPFPVFRQQFSGTLILNGGITPERAEKYVADGVGDLVSFGGLFLSNANLPELIRAGKPLNLGGFDTSLWYAAPGRPDEKGYTDWPLVDPSKPTPKPAF